MAILNVEPPEYYPVIEKLFSTKLVGALQEMGIEILRINSTVNPSNRTLKLSFVIEIAKKKSFLLQMDLNLIIENLLERLSENANRTFGSFYGVKFLVESYKVVETDVMRERKKMKLVISSPPDIEKHINRVGKGLIIYLKEAGPRVSTLVLTIPADGRPRLTVTVVTSEELISEYKDTLSEEIRQKVVSYLRTLNLDYLSVNVKILDPSEETVRNILSKIEIFEREAQKLVESPEIQELMALLGKETPGS